MLLRFIDDHGAEVLFLCVLALLASGCTSQPDNGYELKASIPVSGEVVFH